MWTGIALGIACLLAADPDAAVVRACPTDQEVEGEIVRLGAERGARPEISISGDKMRVLLRGRDGATIGSREVEVPVACHERATVAAVLVATWMGIWPEAPNADPALPAAPNAVASKPVEAAAPHFSVARSTAEIGIAFMGAHDGNAGAAPERLAAPSSPGRHQRSYVGENP